MDLEQLDRELFGTTGSGMRSRSSWRAPTRAPTTAPRRRVAILAVAAIGAVGAVLASTTPARWTPGDLVLSAGFAVLCTLAASRARRWTWVVFAGAGATAADELGPFLVAGAGLVLALGSVVADRRSRLVGAAVGALGVQALLRLPELGFPGGSALFAILASGPLLVSAYVVSPRRVRRRAHRVLLVLVILAAVGGVVLGVGAMVVRTQVETGIDKALEGLAGVREGDVGQAAGRLDEAATSFDDAHGLLTSWWMMPARVVPGIGHQTEALDVTTSEGARVADAAADAASRVDVDAFTWDEGRLDLALVRAARDPLVGAAEAIQDAQDALGELGPWLLPPLEARIERFTTELQDAEPDAALAAELASIGPAILGGNGKRHYLVAFTNPAESRGLGGLVGNWAELTAVGGDVRLSGSGQIRELNRALAEAGAELDPSTAGAPDAALADYIARYEVFRPWEALQDVTLSPDAPTVSRVLEQLYPQAVGTEIDGVLTVDPYALAALMRFTGPIRVDGLEETLTHETAADFLLVDQYARFADESTREDFLDEVTRVVFEELTTGDLPDPEEFADTLAPLVREGRLTLHATRTDEQALFERIGADGALPPVDGGDFLSVLTQNGALNKIDAYLRREIDYDVFPDPEDGTVEATVTVRLHNAVPSLDLPEAVVGSNDQGLPEGTNEVYLNLYTPHRLTTARVDGRELGLGLHRELGRRVYSARLRIPPGERRTVEVELEGSLALRDAYTLGYAPQPLVNDDDVDIRVHAPAGARFASSQSVLVGPTGAVAFPAGDLAEDTVLRAPLVDGP